MTTPLSRRRWLGGSVAALLAWVGLGRRGEAAAPAACPHPMHGPLCAEEPGPVGWWYRTRLDLVCPRCGQQVQHRGYLPGSAFVFSDLVPPPEFSDLPHSVGTFSYSCPGPDPGPGAGPADFSTR